MVEKYQSFCPGNMVEGVALVSSTETNHISHVWNDTLIISFGATNKALYSHKRTFDYTDEDSVAVSGGYYLLSLSRQYATLEGTWTSSFNASIDEDFKANESTIEYMDLRNDIIIIKDMERTVKFEQTSEEKVAGRSTISGTATIHGFRFNDLLGIRKIDNTITTQGTNTLADTQTVTTTQGDLLLPMIPPAGWYAEGNEDWYDFLIEAEPDGGYVLFYPRWIRNMPEINTITDDADRLRFHDIITFSEYVSTAIVDPITIKTGIQGSAAVDSLGNILVSCKTENGVYNRLQTAKGLTVGLPTTLEVPVEYNILYPVAPL